MMKALIKSLCCATLVALTSSHAQAEVVQFAWTTTMAGKTGSFPGVVGEAVTSTFFVDNGGASLESQLWDPSAYRSFRLEGASGWFMEGGQLIQMNGVFSTNANGEVVTAPMWSGMGEMNTSWGRDMGIWFVNGDNFYACTKSDADCLYVNKVGDSQIGASWSVGFDARDPHPVPEPGTLALLALGGLALVRRRERQ